MGAGLRLGERNEPILCRVRRLFPDDALGRDADRFIPDARPDLSSEDYPLDAKLAGNHSDELEDLFHLCDSRILPLPR